MANDKKILLLSGLGTLDDHLVAAAVALRRWPGAELQFVSMGVLPEELLKRAGGGFGEIHLLGIGLEADPAALEKAFRAVRDGGASLVWHSAGYDVPPRIPDPADPKGTRRDFNDIPTEEIAAAVRSVVTRQYSLTTEDLYKEVSRIFGYSRVAQPSVPYLAEGVTYATSHGWVAELNGRIFVKVK